MASQEVFDGVMVGLIAEFPLHNAHKFAVVDRGIKLLDIQYIGSDGLGIAMAFPAGVPGTLILQPQHPVLEEPAGFVPDRGPLQAGLATAFGNGFSKEDNRPDNFVVVLHGVDALQLIRREVFCSRHASPPAPDSEASRFLSWSDTQQETALCRCVL